MDWLDTSKAAGTANMLKAAIAGCGKVSDAHAWAIQSIKGCEIVGACDRELLMATQLCERFHVRRPFGSLEEMLEETRPNVVHVITPPQTHYSIARKCLDSGCHVYVEKPFTLYATEAEELLAFAAQKRLSVTVGHHEQFSHVAQRMRRLVETGYLGGLPVHMESTWCYDLGGNYANAVLGDKNHWARKLPGRLLQNLISHGIARIAEFLVGDNPQVIAHGYVSPLLRNAGEREIVDELRVTICDEQGATAYFTFSSQMHPPLHEFRLFGPKNGLLLNEDQQILIKLRGKRYKSYAENFIPPITIAGQHLQNLLRNGRSFLAGDFHIESGKRYLIESFYRSITDGVPVPIPYREILLTSRIMDAIFEQLFAGYHPGTKLPLSFAVPATPI
jgi:predicted dehydrogenase